MSPRVLLVGVGGASCSGKSTLTNWLAKIFDCKVVHQDKFYLPDSEIPMVNGVADWDCPEAIDTRRFVETLRDAKLAQSGFQSELGDNRPKLDESEVAPQILANLCASAAAAKSLAGCEVVLVDGFLLFQDPRVYLEFGAAFFLRASFETLLARRNARERYITAEGYWEDPPGYFEEFVYPAYLRNNKLILDGKLAQQHADLHASLTILDTDATTIEDNVVRAVARLWPTLPPLAERRPTKLSLHNTTLVDNYAWLRNIDSDPAVARHLADENGYATSVLATLEPLRSALIGELSMPPNMDTGAISPCLPVNELIQTFWEDGDFIYWISYDSAQPNLRPHPIYRRRRHRTLSDDPDDDCICSGANRQPLATAIETVLDLNDVVANNATYVYVGVFEPSPFDPNLITYSLDLDGSERYTLHIHNLHLEGGMDRVIATNTYYSARWQSSHPDASTASHWLLFNSVDPVLGTPTSIWRACVWQCEAKGASGNPSIPHMLYHEKDIAMTVELSSSTDQAVVFIKVVGQITSELHLLLSPSLEGPATRLIARRTQGVVYDAEHHNGVLYVRTNLADRGNFALIRASLADLSERPLPESHSMFETVIPHSPYRFIEKIEVVAGHLVVWFWSDGLRQFCIAALERLPISCEPALLSNPDRAESQVYSLMPGTLEDIDARLFRPRVTTCMLITLSSFLTPRSTFAVSFKDLSLRHVHRSPTRAFDPNLYHQLRLWTTPLGQDSPNMRVPVSVVYRRDAHQTGSKPTEPRPTLLLAYGAYGGFQETAFDGDLFSLLDRGVLVAVCHPRGDGDLGAWWYTQGKYESKANTFADTRGCLMGLIDQGFAREGSIALKGRSAGGLVAGDAIRWMRDGRGPYANVVIAQVPFVDPIADLVDPSVPWTPFEWFEWGSPLNKTIFDAMLRYSPYLNIEPGLQPAALVTTGLHDPRVPFYEPAKFVAKLREFKPAATHESAPLLLRVYGAGHFSSQDGTSRIQELADWYSFVLKFIAQ